MPHHPSEVAIALLLLHEGIRTRCSPIGVSIHDGYGGFMVGKALSMFGATLVALAAMAAIQPFPAEFHAQQIETNGTTLNVRVGGRGPAVVMLHGFADTGDMWAPAAAVLAKDHTVVVPDLRGMGLSAHPDAGYTKKNQAVD